MIKLETVQICDAIYCRVTDRAEDGSVLWAGLTEVGRLKEGDALLDGVVSAERAISRYESTKDLLK